MATTAKPLTYREWLDMPGDPDCIEEVVNGEIRKMRPNRLPHAYIVQNLAMALSRRLDLALFERQDLVVEDGYIHSPAQFVVEGLSPSETRRDAGEKLRDYAALGVPEVWLVSPAAQSVQVLRLTEGRFKTDRILVEGTLSPLKFPEALIDVASIWPN